MSLKHSNNVSTGLMAGIFSVHLPMDLGAQITLCYILMNILSSKKYLLSVTFRSTPLNSALVVIIVFNHVVQD